MPDSHFDPTTMRRSVFELKIEILKAISEGVIKQSHIIQHVNISWTMAQNLIRKLEAQGLIQSQLTKGRKLFIITDRGKRTLDSYLAMIRELDLSLPLQLPDLVVE